MTLEDINTKVDELTKADRTIAYPNANRLINLNIWNHKVFTSILQSQDSSDSDDANQTGYSILREYFIANKRDYNFGVTDGVVQIKKVEVSYDGTTIVRAYPLDSSEIEEGVLDESLTLIDQRFSQQNPAYEWKNNSLLIYPKPTASVGKVYAEVSRTAKDFSLSDLTTGTATPGFDKNFHPMIPYGMAYDYFLLNTMDSQAQSMRSILTEYEFKLAKQYGNKNVEFPLRFEAEYVDYN